MRKVLTIFLLFLTLNVKGGEPADSLKMAALSAKLQEYFEALKYEGLPVQKEECDFLIESTKDSLLRQHVALTIYEHYRDSDIMGTEAVAIHVLDKWFIPGVVRMRDDAELFGAKMFAEFNRRSLTGMPAPPLSGFAPDGTPVGLFTDEDAMGRFRVLYFYDTDCASCKIQTILLRNLLNEGDFPVDFYAFYASDKKEAWDAYVADQLALEARRTKVFHLWDPELESDFQRNYGVVQTPRLFLVGPDGTILGRGLDAAALAQLLHGIFDEAELEYGSDQAIEMYDGIFGDSELVPAEEVTGLIDYAAAGSMQKGDTLMFRQMMGDLLYYLPLRRGEGYKEGLDHLVDTYILSRPDVWRSHDDSLKVVEYAGMMDELLSKSEPGKMVKALKLPGVLLSSRKEKAGQFDLSRLGGRRNIIMFVTDGCRICAAEKEAARRLAGSDRKARVLIVDVDKVVAEYPASADRMFDDFDLSTLPFAVETDRKGRILRRYISLSL